MTSTISNPVNESTRNGVDTATLFATLDAVKAAPEAAKFQFRAQQRMDQRHPQPQHDPRLLRRRRGARRTSGPSASTPTTRPCSSGATTARPRWSTCCTPWPPA